MKILFQILTIYFSFQLLAQGELKAEIYRDVTVAKDGSGDYTTIADALNDLSFPNIKPYTIFIKEGVYNEKIRIEKDHVILIGESKNKTIIEFNQAQKTWNQHKDYAGPAVVNIHADDVTLKNMTVHNTMEDLGPTAYAVYGTGTRTIIENCKVLNNGANTITLVDYKSGMYYIKDCYIEGTVDFLKAMGTCYVEGCHLYQKEAISSIWQASINNQEQKMVVKDCYFDGVEHFFLGRHHYDAQFFIINCNFNKKLADKDLYRKTYKNKPEKNKPNVYGDRHYYYGCKTEGEKYKWLNDNLKSYDKSLTPKQITAEWAFGEQWNPEISK